MKHKFTTPFCSEDEVLNQFNMWGFKRYAKNKINFIDSPLMLPVADVGVYNMKSEEISKRFDVSVSQIGNGIDFDRERIVSGKWGTITVFDTLEHLLNPLFFLSSLKDLLLDGGALYLSLPQRPKWLWTEHHWHEIDDIRCKYLFSQAGFYVEKQKRFSFWNLKFGIRPLLRVFFDKGMVYKLRKIQ